MTRWRLLLNVVCLRGLFAGWLLLGWAGSAAADVHVFTSGTRGTVFPCGSCPRRRASGGLLHGGPRIRDQLGRDGSAVWLDLGHAFTGGDLPPDRLSLLTEIYADLGVSALNVATGDFRHGFDFLHELLADSGLPVVSANLVWEDTRDPVFATRLRVRSGESETTIIGLMEPPAGLEMLPQLREQFAGVDVLDPARVLQAQLEEVSAERSVGVLYHGSSAGLREVAEVARRHGGSRIWIAAPASSVKGLRPVDGELRLIPVPDDGRSLTRFDPGASPRVTDLPIVPDREEDGFIREQLQKAGIPDPGSVPVRQGESDTGKVDLRRLEEDAEMALTGASAHRGLRVAVHGVSMRSSLGDTDAGPGKRFAVVEVSFENRQAIDLLLEKDYPEPLLVGELKNQLFLKLNHRVVAPLFGGPVDAVAMPLPPQFTLSRSGARRRGNVVFEIPDVSLSALSLVFVPEKFPPLEVRMAGEAPGPVEDAVARGTSKDFLSLEVAEFEVVEAYRGEPAPEGMRWAVVELTGQSELNRTLDARAVDAGADLDAVVEVPRAVRYLKAPDLLQLVVDGRHATVRQPRLSSLAPEPAFLPGDSAGGTAVFPVVADAASIELRADFPAFRDTGGSRNPESIRLTLRKAEEPVDSPEALARIEDSPLPLSVDRATYEDGARRLRIEVTLRNTREEGGMYEASSRASVRLPDGSVLSPLRVEGKGGVPLREPFWIPAGNVPRSFSFVFETPEKPSSVQFAYGGVNRSGRLSLDLEGEEEGGELAATGVETEEGGTGSGRLSSRVLKADLAPAGRSRIDLEPVVWEAPRKEDEEEVVVNPPGEGMAVGRRLRGEGFTLTARRLFVLDGYYGNEAEEGTVWLGVEVEWRRQEGVDAVEISGVEEKMPMRVDGRRLQSMVRFRRTDPQAPDSFTLDEETPSLRRFVFYPVSAEGVASAELVWIPDGEAPSKLRLLPADGGDPEREEPKRRAENRVAALGLYGADVRETFLGRSSSEGDWLVVDVRGRSLLRSEEAHPQLYVWREWRPRMQLILDGVRAVPLQRKRHDFDPEARLLPEWMTGGEFGFQVSKEALEEAEVVQLQCGFAPAAIPGDRVRTPETLYFTLKGDPESLPAPPEALQSLTDLEFKLDVLGMSRPEEVRNRSAGKGASWLRLDFAVEGLAEAGTWFSARETLRLIAPDRSVIGMHRYASRGEEGPPQGGKYVWIPKGGRREFRLLWAVPEDAGPVRLRVDGVRHFRALTLFPEEEEGLDRPDPEENLSIAEDGLRVLNPGAEEGGIEAVGLTAAQVNEAIDKGRDYLWRRLREEWGERENVHYGREHFLMMLALVHADAHLEFPAFDRRLRQFLRRTRIEDNTVYENSLVAMIIEGYGDPTFLPKMEQVAHWLVETQGEQGTWTYKAPVPSRFFPEPASEPEEPEGALAIEGGGIEEPYEPLEEPIGRTQSWELGRDGDHSCTQFAVLGLWSAERSGVPVDPEVWRRVLTRMTRHQTLGRNHERYGGYGYRRQGGAYGSMTAAGICTLAIAMNRLFDDMTPREHLRIRNALGWMVRNFTVRENPGTKKYNYYYIYSVERVGRILGIDFMGDHEWYPEGANYLVGAQRGDGSWPTGKGESEPELTSSYALLFLTRATPELEAEPEEAPEGPGTLVTRVDRPEVRHHVYLILDVSGSMRAQIEGKMKLDIARGAVEDMMQALPEGTRVAVRAYGHRKRSIDPGADEDTELILPWMEVDAEKVMSTLNSLRPRGKTPMAVSLKQAAGDVGRGKGKTLLVLLTDGGERSRTTDPVKEAAAFAGRDDVEFFLLGFDINRPDWTRQLEKMAEAGEGVYRPVQEAARLTRDLRAVVFPPVPAFEVVERGADGGTPVDFGGEPLELEPGEYVLRSQESGFEEAFRIRAGGTTRITLDMARLVEGGGE